MKLQKFRVTNFRSVFDSGWIDASDVTALIGENESGKTNLLLSLWKLNPLGEGEINHFDDMPRSRYAEMRKNPEEFNFIECIFELENVERDTIANFGVAKEIAKNIVVKKNFAGRLSWLKYCFVWLHEIHHMLGSIGDREVKIMSRTSSGLGWRRPTG